jgi:hypothetical protein
MVYNRECVTCTYLEVCQTTSAAKILSHFVCEYFQEVNNEEQVVKARCDVINKFGAAGLSAIAPRKKEKPDE